MGKVKKALTSHGFLHEYKGEVIRVGCHANLPIPNKKNIENRKKNKRKELIKRHHGSALNGYQHTYQQSKITSPMFFLGQFIT